MAGLETQLTSLAVGFGLVLARVGAMVGTAPLLSDASIPRQVKALLAVALSALVTPIALATGDLPEATTLVGFGALAAQEAVVGLALGLGVMAVLSGVQLTGQIVGQMSGMALAEGADPVFGGSTTAFAQAYYLATTAVFVTLGGHRVLLEGLLRTFDAAPPGTAALSESLVRQFAALVGLGFELAIRAAAPLLLALLLATLVVGLIGRTLPQINAIVVGFSVNALIALSTMMISIGAAALTFQAPLASVVERMTAAIADGGVLEGPPAEAAPVADPPLPVAQLER